MLQGRESQRKRSVGTPSPASETPWSMSDVPEVIEVEPVVRRLTAVMREPIRIALGPPANIVFAPILRQQNLIAEEFQMHVVAIPPAVQTEEHDDRGTDGMRQS